MTTIVKEVNYVDAHNFASGTKRKHAECPFCQKMAHAYVTDGIAVFMGNCEHFCEDKANIVQAVFQKEEIDEQNS